MFNLIELQIYEKKSILEVEKAFKMQRLFSRGKFDTYPDARKFGGIWC